MLNDKDRLFDSKQKSFVVTHNLKGNSVDEWEKQFKTNEVFRLRKRKDNTHVFHEILSWHRDDAQNITLSKMEEMAREYIRQRNPRGMYVAVPHFDRNHYHIHICSSGIEYKTGKSLRLSKPNLLKLKKEIQEFQINRFPELSKSVVEHGKKAKGVACEKEFQIKLRTGRSSEKERAKEIGLIPYGISFHVGSQSGNPHAWASGLKSITQPLKELFREGITLEVINLGGGFPCKYLSCESHTSLNVIAQNTFNEYRKLPYQPKLIVEPGRGIIAETGVLVTSVIAKVQRKDTMWLFLDAGVYNGLFESMSYQGSTRYRVSRLRRSNNSDKALFALAGPTGDSPDVISREMPLPLDTEVGDKLIIHDVGAYSISVTSEFNGFPKPKVYFI
jgi:hypothetical protein